MAYWLLKTEPSSYSFDDLLRDRKTRWDGITNPVALRHLRLAKAGDVAVVYHTGGERACIGTATVAGPAYPDPETGSGKLFVVDLVAGDRLARAVALGELKGQKVFEGSPLARQGRLSFVPLTDAQWKAIRDLASRGT